MKKTVSLSACLLMGLAVIGLQLLSAAEKTVSLPKGTKIVKLGAGHFRFVLPNGQTTEIKNYDARNGLVGEAGVYHKGKLVMRGRRGNLRGIIDPDPPFIVKLPKGNAYIIFRDELANLRTLAKVPHSDYVMIDDEVTWLPATIRFRTGTGGRKGLSPQPDPPGMRTVTLPKGTTAARLGPGHVRFSLPNGHAVEVLNWNSRTGIIGDCGVYDRGKLVMKGSGGKLTGIINPDPPTVIRSAKARTFLLFNGELINAGTLARVPHSDYVTIDDEVTWLPATIRFD
jgi:hypothetical protein